MHHGGGLARAGYGEDQRRAVVVPDDSLLLFGQGQGHAGDCITGGRRVRSIGSAERSRGDSNKEQHLVAKHRYRYRTLLHQRGPQGFAAIVARKSAVSIYSSRRVEFSHSLATCRARLIICSTT